MLSLTVISANQGGTYYTAENYYSNEETQAYSGWFGKGARQLGLSGQVQGDAFKNLLHGYHPKGDSTLSGRKIDPERHRAGIDLTFSAPKSISLAAVGEGATAQERELATLMTRAPKGKEIPREELRAFWQDQAQVLNLDHPQPQAIDWRSQPKRAVQAGLNHCSEQEAVFKREQVERFALENHLGQQFFEDVEQTLDLDLEVIHTHDQRLTTQTAVLRKLETIRTVLDGRGQAGAIAAEDWVATQLEDQGLTQGQH
jgi:hypothetical protein